MKKTILLLIILSAFLLMGCEDLNQTSVLETDLITTQTITNDFQSTDLVTTEEPTVDELTSSVVSTDDLSTEVPTTEAPTSAIPTTDEEVTTELSTTVISTTEVYTTLEPTTVEMTTVTPSTEEQTTEEMTTEWNPLIDINLFSFNDFHGGAYTDMSMVSNIASYLKSFEGYHLEIANGDIFQGSALSNYYHGRVLVEALNEIGFDGFVIGNHEFDWGIEVIGDYADGDDLNGEFNHPILAANIVYSDSQEPLPFTQPFFIEEFEGVKVGVIGLIGNIENSIASSRLDNIEFLDPVETAAQYASRLRTEYDVDIVVVYIHDSSDRNQEYAALSGLEKIDAMFNGHSHQNEASDIDRDGIDMPYAQMNNYDTSLVGIRLTFNKGTNMVIDFNVYGVYNDMMTDRDDAVDDIIEYYSQDVVYLNYINEVLAETETDYGRYDMAQWGCICFKRLCRC
jgi:2',3'-cyclic-nucleotide 2'-phosphodiesterase (5'-nucleotidase family)/uncharacterized protein YcfL